MLTRIKRWMKRREIEEEVEWEYHRAIAGFNPDEADSIDYGSNLEHDELAEPSIVSEFIQSEGTRMEHVHRALINLERDDIYQAMLDMSIAVETMLKTVLVIKKPNVKMSELISKFSKRVSYKDLEMTSSQFKSMIDLIHEIRIISNAFKHGVDRNGSRHPSGTETAKKFYPLSKQQASEMIEFLSIAIEKAYSWHNRAIGVKKKEVHYYHQDHIICSHCGRRNDAHRNDCEYCGAAL